MAWFFGDGFDLYAAPADAYLGGTYWDSGNANWSLVAGRFSGGRAMQLASLQAVTPVLLKSSGANETVHHLNVAVQQLAALTGTNTLAWFTFSDGATAQCTVSFRSDGAILLIAGASNGTTLATYTGAITAINTWYGFEIEVVVSNTAGSMTVRKNGNPSNDFASATNLDTSANANNYANRLGIGANSSSSYQIDDFLWRSDASSVAWVGDIRCYTRMPASDAGVQWTPSGAVLPQAYFPGVTTTTGTTPASARYMPFTPVCDGTVGSFSVQATIAATVNIKGALYASAAGVPTTVLASATLVTNPAAGTVTFTFPTPIAVTRGTTYFVAYCGDAATGSFVFVAIAPYGYLSYSGGTYAAFPATNPAGLSTSSSVIAFTVNITPTVAANAPFVADMVQDAAVSYVSSSTVGQTDLYGIAPISTTPASVVGVTTRALCQKSDAGTRNIGMQLKSGSTTSNGTSTALNTSWGWVWRVDLNDPATSAPWTPVAVNNLQIGEAVTA
jgi:hypothetical protein